MGDPSLKLSRTSSPFGSCAGQTGQNALIKDKCTSRASLLDVVRCFEGILGRQENAADLRDALQHLPAVRMATTASTAFKGVLDACEFALGAWPRRFMEQEMGAALMYCQRACHEVHGQDFVEVLSGTFDYVKDKFCDVRVVVAVVEERDRERYLYHLLLFSDGSHLCQCRNLQTLGLGCRHFWASMLRDPRFQFHIGLQHEHWLTEHARGTPEKDWPPAARPRWVVANRHAAPGTVGGFEWPALDHSAGGGWKALVGSSQTVQTVLLDLKQKGHTEQDKQVVYADVSKRLGQAASILSDSFPPAVALALTEAFLAEVSSQAKAHNAVEGPMATYVANPATVRVPARASNKRKRGAAEKGTRAASKRAATSGSR